ncbi:MAG: hypothetical protein ACD_4C00058G0001, partial [uncultured bacterium (gcode 4)]
SVIIFILRGVEIEFLIQQTENNVIQTTQLVHDGEFDDVIQVVSL